MESNLQRVSVYHSLNNSGIRHDIRADVFKPFSDAWAIDRTVDCCYTSSGDASAWGGTVRNVAFDLAE